MLLMRLLFLLTDFIRPHHIPIQTLHCMRSIIMNICMEIKCLSKYSLFEDYYFTRSVVLLQVTQVFRNIYLSFFYKTTIHSLTVNYLTEYCTSLGTHPLCIEEEGVWYRTHHRARLSQKNLITKPLCIHNTHAVSPRLLGKGDNSMMRAIPDPFLSMQRGQVLRLVLYSSAISIYQVIY